MLFWVSLLLEVWSLGATDELYHLYAVSPSTPSITHIPNVESIVLETVIVRCNAKTFFVFLSCKWYLKEDVTLPLHCLLYKIQDSEDS